MPQIVEFPQFPGSDHRRNMQELLSILQGSVDVSDYVTFRKRLKDNNLYIKESAVGLQKFLQISSKMKSPSPLALEIASAEAPEQALVQRMWDANPPLFVAIFRCLQERVHSRDELFSIIDSSAYRGKGISRQSLQAWLDMSLGLEITKKVGISLGLGAAAEAFTDLAEAFDYDEFCEEDIQPQETEVAPEIESTPKAAIVATASVEQEVLLPAVNYSSPHEAPKPVATMGKLTNESKLTTAKAILQWWAEQEKAAAPKNQFGFEYESWMESPSETFYRIGVAAMLLQRQGESKATETFGELSKNNLLSGIFHGDMSMSETPQVDTGGLFMASVIAQRCAANSEVAIDLEKQSTGQEILAEISKVFEGCLNAESVMWIAETLQSLGALAQTIAIPKPVPREVRDTLFRLGHISSPYTDIEQIAVQAAVSKFFPTGGTDALNAFAQAAQCTYQCGRSDTCGFGCKERLR